MEATGKAVITVDSATGAEITLNATAGLAEVFHALAKNEGAIITLPIENVPGWTVKLFFAPGATPTPAPAPVLEGVDA